MQLQQRWQLLRVCLEVPAGSTAACVCVPHQHGNQPNSIYGIRSSSSTECTRNGAGRKETGNPHLLRRAEPDLVTNGVTDVANRSASHLSTTLEYLGVSARASLLAWSTQKIHVVLYSDDICSLNISYSGFPTTFTKKI